MDFLLSDIPGRNITRTKSCWTGGQKSIKLASIARPRELNEADGARLWRKGLYVNPDQPDHPK
jgi:hypothetical protein